MMENVISVTRNCVTKCITGDLEGFTRPLSSLCNRDWGNFSALNVVVVSQARTLKKHNSKPSFFLPPGATISFKAQRYFSRPLIHRLYENWETMSLHFNKRLTESSLLPRAGTYRNKIHFPTCKLQKCQHCRRIFSIAKQKFKNGRLLFAI